MQRHQPEGVLIAFAYQLLLASWAQEQLYQEMRRRGGKSLRLLVRELLLEAAQEEDMVERALKVAEEMV